MAMVLAFGLAMGSARADEFASGGFSFRTGEVPAFVEDRPLPSEWPAAAPGAQDEQWRFWRYDRQVDHRPGADVAYTDYVYEPRSQGNIADAGRFDLSFNPDYQQLTLHRVELRRNGRWESRLKPKDISIARRERQFEQDIADGLVAALIVIEDVRAGDVVRISWSVTGSNPILAGQFSEQARLAFSHPILDLRLRAYYAPGTQIASHLENGAPAPTVSTSADATVVEVRAAAVDRLQDEGDYPVWYQPYPPGPVRAAPQLGGRGGVGSAAVSGPVRGRVAGRPGAADRAVEEDRPRQRTPAGGAARGTGRGPLLRRGDRYQFASPAHAERGVDAALRRLQGQDVAAGDGAAAPRHPRHAGAGEYRPRPRHPGLCAFGRRLRPRDRAR
jgi:hypothetical protein